MCCYCTSSAWLVYNIGTYTVRMESDTTIRIVSVESLDDTLREMRFEPDTITITRGMTVAWDNETILPQTVTSGVLKVGPDGRFDSGLFVKGARFAHRFDDVGEYPYFSLLYPWMRGRVRVQ